MSLCSRREETPAQVEKIRGARVKIMERVIDRYRVRFEGNHNIMLASMVAAADRTPLIALYWSCPACAKGLEAAFAEPAVHQYLNSRVSALERALGSKGALRLFSQRLQLVEQLLVQAGSRSPQPLRVISR